MRKFLYLRRKTISPFALFPSFFYFFFIIFASSYYNQEYHVKEREGFIILSRQPFLISVFDEILNLSKNYHLRSAKIDDFDGFLVIPYCRFGNNFLQFVNALTMCHLFNYKKLVIYNNFLFFKEDFDAGDVHVKILKENEDKTRLIIGQFYNPYIKINRTIVDTFKQEFYKYIPNITVGENDLYIHIRSGDVYNMFPHEQYSQPPLAFYSDILNLKKWDSIHIISEDSKSPLYPSLISFGCNHQENSFKIDLTYLLSSYNLVLSQGSFGLMVIYLSKNLRLFFNFYYYKSFWSNIELTPRYTCFSDALYFREMVGIWRNSWLQRKILFKSKCAHWQYFK